MDDPRFTLAVQSGFEEDGTWVIDIGLDGPLPESVGLGELRLAVIEVIAREGLRGRELNASRVRVSLDDSILGVDPSLSSIPTIVH